MSQCMTKPTKWHVRPAKTEISLGIRPVWSVFAVRMKKAWILSYPLSTQQRLIRCPGWSESLLSQISFCRFCRVLAHIRVVEDLEVTRILAHYISHRTKYTHVHKTVCFIPVFFFFFFFGFGFYDPFKNISLISSRSFIEGGRKPENPEKNHLTIRKQNLAFPHMTRARLEPQRWET